MRRNHKARRYILRLKPSTRELVLTMPMRGSLTAAKAFLQRHEGWIETRLSALPDRILFVDGSLVPIRGELHRISHVEGRGVTRIVVDAERGHILVVSGEAAHVPRRIQDFLKKSAKEDLAKATAHYAEKLEVSVKRVSIKDTSSRWGSCSSSGSISYSWRIILAPPFVLDYLAAHEVAHRREMNHSVRFWSVVKAICPHMDAAEAWLKCNGSGLHRYG